MRPRHLREMLLYLLLPAAGMLSPLLIIPAVTHRFGAAGWAAVAVAQSMGTSILVATEMGWGVVGPQRVAGLSPEKAIEQYRLSITSRLITVIPGMLIAGIITYFVVDELNWPAAVLAFGLAGQAMTPSWYFIGVGKPLHVFWSESMPRLLIALVSGIAIFNGAPLITYSVLMLASVPIAQLIARKFIGPDSKIRASDWHHAVGTARSQTIMGLGRAVSVTYTALPVTLVQIFSPTATAVFAASDRLMRMTLQVLNTVPLRLQSWIGSAPIETKDQRLKTARKYMAALGAASGITFAVLAPTASSLIFSGAVHIPYYVSAASGVLLFTIVVSTSWGLTLVALGKPNDITRAIIPSAIVGLVLIGPIAFILGPTGAIGGEVLAEATGLGIQKRRSGNGPAHEKDMLRSP